MLELKIQGIKKYMDSTLVLENVSLEAYGHEKVGIVGMNGSGKSTILRIIAGLEPMNYYPGYPQTTSFGYDEGLIHRPKHATCAYLEQTPHYPSHCKVIDVLNEAFEEVMELEGQLREIEAKMNEVEGVELERLLKKYSDVTQQFEAKGGYEREEKLAKVCTGLKFTEEFLQKDFSMLSGGEKTTVGLGRLLMNNPEVLLLDEPTNHLDMDSVEWLEGFLRNYKGIVLIVSHDRYFLDNVVTKIVEIEDMESTMYKGNYSSFVEQKEENMRILYEQYREQQKKIHGMQQQIKSLRDWAMRADNNKFFRRAASIQKRLDKMEKIDKPVSEREKMKLQFHTTDRSGKETIKAMEISKRYGDKVLLDAANAIVHYGERVSLIGANGSGKTTFLRMLLEEEAPDSGQVAFGASVKAAYLPQKFTFTDENSTVLETFREDFDIFEGKAREYLAKFMFFGGSVFKKVKQLSGGERIRLKLAILLFQEINVLILDEPTNHLDIESIETLEAALDDFKGTIFFISHDRYFINKFASRLIALENATLTSYAGNYDYYRQQKEKEVPVVVEKPKKVVVREVEKAPKVDRKRVEERIFALEQQVAELEKKLEDATLGLEDMQKLYEKKQAADAELEAAMLKWMELE
ncbi:ribosomal protection-like ABC-F family protein [Mangrovibacillus cuniculi]|uniref:ABC-F type ribosomal protection protein n=1 Tax=Mangrovibacillus cuniculi TaxID=2593652 RepID=A0A7S8C9C7_9BACI|nr:ABC-F type ribosomal protection protein [Mangrovibacillus cuniculi]QPC45628.1 ABC-F type ribosomal protection protein [Mangrovibacillus cuniculi]